MQLQEAQSLRDSTVVLDEREGSLLEPESVPFLQEAGIAAGRQLGKSELTLDVAFNEARPVRPGGFGSGRKYRPSMFAMLALAAGASLEPMTAYEALHGVDDAEPPKPKTPRTTWGFCGMQQYHMGQDGEPIPVRLNDPKANLNDRRKQLKAKRRK